MSGDGALTGNSEVGSLCFFLHPKENWVLGCVSAKEESGEVTLTACEEDQVEEDERRHTIPPDRAAGEVEVVTCALDPVKDLLDMPVLTDATLLHQVRRNYWDQCMYTNIGQIVLSMNPYDYGIPHYQECHMPDYIKEGKSVLWQGSKEMTHAWSVAHRSYWAMQDQGRPQSVLVSGESGAGKTEAAKMVVKYLAAVSTTLASSERVDTAKEICRRVESTSPILESFGNAKTERNDNSSRFGKFMTMQFDAEGLLIGAHVTNYLLEKSRVITHGKCERSYHSFYQLLAGASAEEKERLGLTNPAKYDWLFAGGEPTEAELTEDANQYAEVRAAMTTIGMSEEEQWQAYQVLAGIMLFQSIEFDKKGNGDADITGESLEILGFICKELWKVDPDVLKDELLFKKTALYTTNLKQDQARDTRDGISKELYRSMFQSLIDGINSVLAVKNPDGSLQTEPENDCWIGLLDIFGFENFEKNSFEQLCINYANEVLQQHYNTCVFERDIQLYKSEGIDISEVQAPDNRATIDLLADQAKRGIFALLDDQAKSQGSDDKLYETIKSEHSRNPNLTLPRINDSSFEVRHYAAPVKYLATGMKDKNMDPFKDTVKDLFRNSTASLVARLFPPPEPTEDGGGKKKGGVATVGAFFRKSMSQLLTTIYRTDPHWIRCVKPHSKKKKRMFHGNEVMQQLRSAGVLQTVEIRKSGYAWRLEHAEFWSRFKMVATGGEGITGRKATGMSPSELTEGCRSILEGAEGLDGEALLAQVGTTRVFLKDEGMKVMEENRGKRLHQKIVTLQSFARYQSSAICREKKRLLGCIRLMQAFTRSTAAQQRARELELERLKRRMRAALLTQREFRARLARDARHRKFLLTHCLQRVIQPSIQGHLARRKLQAMQFVGHLKLIQRHMKVHVSGAVYLAKHRERALLRIATARSLQLFSRAFISTNRAKEKHRKKYELTIRRCLHLQTYVRAKLCMFQAADRVPGWIEATKERLRAERAERERQARVEAERRAAEAAILANTPMWERTWTQLRRSENPTLDLINEALGPIPEGESAEGREAMAVEVDRGRDNVGFEKALDLGCSTLPMREEKPGEWRLYDIIETLVDELGKKHTDAIKLDIRLRQAEMEKANIQAESEELIAKAKKSGGGLEWNWEGIDYTNSTECEETLLQRSQDFRKACKSLEARAMELAEFKKKICLQNQGPAVKGEGPAVQHIRQVTEEAASELQHSFPAFAPPDAPGVNEPILTVMAEFNEFLSSNNATRKDLKATKEAINMVAKFKQEFQNHLDNVSILPPQSQTLVASCVGRSLQKSLLNNCLASLGKAVQAQQVNTALMDDLKQSDSVIKKVKQLRHEQEEILNRASPRTNRKRGANSPKAPEMLDPLEEDLKLRRKILDHLTKSTEKARKGITGFRSTAIFYAKQKKREEEEKRKVQEACDAAAQALQKQKSDLKVVKDRLLRARAQHSDTHRIRVKNTSSKERAAQMRKTIVDCSSQIEVALTDLLQIQMEEAADQARQAEANDAKDDSQGALQALTRSGAWTSIEQIERALDLSGKLQSSYTTCVEESSFALFNTFQQGSKGELYEQLSESHNELWKLSTELWDVLTAAWNRECDLLDAQRAACDRDKASDDPEAERRLAQNKSRTIETVKRLSGLREHFQQTVNAIKQMKTVEFHVNDPKLKSKLGKVVTEEVFWKERFAEEVETGSPNNTA